jgi:hypothetical protein
MLLRGRSGITRRGNQFPFVAVLEQFTLSRITTAICYARAKTAILRASHPFENGKKHFQMRCWMKLTYNDNSIFSKTGQVKEARFVKYCVLKERFLFFFSKQTEAEQLLSLQRHADEARRPEFQHQNRIHKRGQNRFCSNAKYWPAYLYLILPSAFGLLVYDTVQPCRWLRTFREHDGSTITTTTTTTTTTTSNLTIGASCPNETSVMTLGPHSVTKQNTNI